MASPKPSIQPTSNTLLFPYLLFAPGAVLSLGRRALEREKKKVEWRIKLGIPPTHSMCVAWACVCVVVAKELIQFRGKRGLFPLLQTG